MGMVPKTSCPAITLKTTRTGRQLTKLISIFISRVVVLESHVLQNNTLSGEDGNDLYILAGHEASY